MVADRVFYSFILVLIPSCIAWDAFPGAVSIARHWPTWKSIPHARRYSTFRFDSNISLYCLKLYFTPLDNQMGKIKCVYTATGWTWTPALSRRPLSYDWICVHRNCVIVQRLGFSNIFTVLDVCFNWKKKLTALRCFGRQMQWPGPARPPPPPPSIRPKLANVIIFLIWLGRVRPDKSLQPIRVVMLALLGCSTRLRLPHHRNGGVSGVSKCFPFSFFLICDG